MSQLVPSWRDKAHWMLPQPPLQNVPLNAAVRKQENHDRTGLNVPGSDPVAFFLALVL